MTKKRLLQNLKWLLALVPAGAVSYGVIGLGLMLCGIGPDNFLGTLGDWLIRRGPMPFAVVFAGAYLGSVTVLSLMMSDLRRSTLLIILVLFFVPLLLGFIGYRQGLEAARQGRARCLEASPDRVADADEAFRLSARAARDVVSLALLSMGLNIPLLVGIVAKYVFDPSAAVRPPPIP